MKVSKDLNKLYSLLLGLVIGLSALAQGMYKDGSQYVFMLVASVLIFVYFLIKGIDLRPHSLLDWFVILCVPVYMISSFTAVSLWDSLACIGRYLCCYLVYFLGKEIFKEHSIVMYRVIYYISSAISLFGIIRSIGGIGYDSKKGLLLSVFQYHNASAIFFTAVFVLGIYIVTKASFIEKCIITVCNTLLISSIVYSQSRGTWFVLAVSTIVYIVFSRKSKAFSDICISVGAAFIGIIVSMNGFMNAFSARNDAYVCEKPFQCVFFLFLSVLIGVAIVFILEKTKLKSYITPKVTAVSIPILFVVVVIFIMFVAPDAITERIRDFSLSSSTVSERRIFFEDAMRIFKDNPVTGIGGNCWQYVYPSYQNSYYTVAHPHSYFAELATDAGIFGVLLYAFLIIAFIVSLFKCKGEEKLPAKIIVVSLLIHSMFDFDTDFFTILIMLFAMLSVIAADSTRECKKFKFAAILPVLLFVWAGLNGLSMMNYNNAISAASEGKSPHQVYEYTSKSIKLMPVKSDYLTVHGNICLGLAGENIRYLDEAGKSLLKSYDLNRYHYETITQLSIYYINRGDYKKSCDTISELMESQPFIPVTYTRLSNVYEMVEKYGEDTADIDCIVYACNMIIDNLNHAYDLSNKNATYILIDLKARENFAEAKEILHELEKFGV